MPDSVAWCTRLSRYLAELGVPAAATTTTAPHPVYTPQPGGGWGVAVPDRWVAERADADLAGGYATRTADMAAWGLALGLAATLYGTRATGYATTAGVPLPLPYATRAALIGTHALLRSVQHEGWHRRALATAAAAGYLPVPGTAGDIVRAGWGTLGAAHRHPHPYTTLAAEVAHSNPTDTEWQATLHHALTRALAAPTPPTAEPADTAVITAPDTTDGGGGAPDDDSTTDTAGGAAEDEDGAGSDGEDGGGEDGGGEADGADGDPTAGGIPLVPGDSGEAAPDTVAVPDLGLDLGGDEGGDDGPGNGDGAVPQTDVGDGGGGGTEQGTDSSSGGTGGDEVGALPDMPPAPTGGEAEAADTAVAVAAARERAAAAARDAKARATWERAAGRAKAQAQDRYVTATTARATWVQVRPPAPEELVLAKDMATALRKARIQEPHRVRQGRAVPPGRVDQRQLMLRKAQRQQRAKPTAQPFVRRNVVRAPDPPLVVGYAVDTSGSMGWAMRAINATAYALGVGAHKAGGTFAAVAYGGTPRLFVQPGRLPTGVTGLKAMGGDERYSAALRVLDGALGLSHTATGARVIFAFTDGVYSPTEARKGAADTDYLVGQGVKIVWITNMPDNAPPGTTCIPIDADDGVLYATLPGIIRDTLSTELG